MTKEFCAIRGDTPTHAVTYSPLFPILALCISGLRDGRLSRNPRVHQQTHIWEYILHMSLMITVPKYAFACCDAAKCRRSTRRISARGRRILPPFAAPGL